MGGPWAQSFRPLPWSGHFLSGPHSVFFLATTRKYRVEQERWSRPLPAAHCDSFKSVTQRWYSQDLAAHCVCPGLTVTGRLLVCQGSGARAPRHSGMSGATRAERPTAAVVVQSSDTWGICAATLATGLPIPDFQAEVLNLEPLIIMIKGTLLPPPDQAHGS